MVHLSLDGDLKKTKFPDPQDVIRVSAVDPQTSKIAIFLEKSNSISIYDLPSLSLANTLSLDEKYDPNPHSYPIIAINHRDLFFSSPDRRELTLWENFQTSKRIRIPDDLFIQQLSVIDGFGNCDLNLLLGNKRLIFESTQFRFGRVCNGELSVTEGFDAHFPPHLLSVSQDIVVALVTFRDQNTVIMKKWGKKGLSEFKYDFPNSYRPKFIQQDKNSLFFGFRDDEGEVRFYTISLTDLISGQAGSYKELNSTCSRFDSALYIKKFDRLACVNSHTIKYKSGEKIDTLTTSFINKSSWITVTPEGFFKSEGDISDLIYLTSEAEVVKIDQLFGTLYRPDLVHEKLKGDHKIKLAMRVRYQTFPDF